MRMNCRVLLITQKDMLKVTSFPIAFGNQTISRLGPLMVPLAGETHGFAVPASQQVCLYRVQSFLGKIGLLKQHLLVTMVNTILSR